VARLRQLRLVSIGHVNARFGDVTLDFTRAGQPADSTIWLRNGGGKSSLLSLFFGLVRPDLREFLGAKADAGQRRLDQYVGDADRSVVAALWELDDATLFLTGAFYERRSGTGELRKLWFSGVSSADEPRVSLAGLPLHGEAGRRRTLTSFREEWLTLRDARPDLQLAATEVQRDWAERLRSAGIDPELFSYQLRMNTREGGADELFRFSDHEDFVDFLLELSFAPEHANEVSNNVGRYREQLRLRKQEYLPERELVAALIAAMQPMTVLAGERARLLAEAALARDEVADLGRHVARRLEALGARAASAAAELALAERMQKEARELERAARVRAAQLTWFATRARHVQAERDTAEIDRRYKEADTSRRRWASARTLRDLRRHEDAVAELTRQLTRRQAEHEPLRGALVEAAQAYAGALEAALVVARRQQAQTLAEIAAGRARAHEQRELATARRRAAATHEQRVAVLEAALTAARRERERLIAAGVLGAGETVDQAATRWSEARLMARGGEERWRLRAAELEDETAVVLARLESLGRESGRLDAAVAALERELARTRAEEASIEAMPMLARLLDEPRVTLERAGDLEPRLLQAHAQVAQRLLEHRNARSLGERALHHLRTEGFLPPSPEVAELVRQLAARVPGIRAGWKEIATNGPPGAAARREAVRRHPHLATGVIVRDADWQRACELAAEAPAPEIPVVLAPQRAFAGPPVDGFVLGPASDAYFDRDAASAEAVPLEASDQRRAR
jgi:hypothetical protein